MPILMLLRKLMFSPKGLKFLGYGLLAVALVTGAGVLHHKIWQSGYDKAVAEMQSDQLEAIERAVADARAEWERSNEVANDVLDKERALREATNELTKQIPKAIADSSCSHLGPEFLRLFNAATQGTSEGGDAGPAGKSSPGVP